MAPWDGLGQSLGQALSGSPTTRRRHGSTATAVRVPSQPTAAESRLLRAARALADADSGAPWDDLTDSERQTIGTEEGWILDPRTAPEPASRWGSRPTRGGRP